MVRSPRVVVLSVLAMVLFLVSTRLEAQPVYVTSTGNQILQVDFGNGTTQQVAYVNGTNFQGLAVRTDDAFIVADSAQGGGVWVIKGGSQTKLAFSQAGGVDVDPDGNILAVNATSGGVDTVVRFRRAFSGDYTLTTIDADVAGTQELADVKFVPFTSSPLIAGDIVVLVHNPAMVLRYAKPTPISNDEDPWASCAPNCSPTTLIGTSAFGGRTPTGFAFTPNGDFVITTVSGDILRFKADGSPRTAPGRTDNVWATLPGNGAKIAVGTQDGSVRAFATIQPGGGVQRYNIGTGLDAWIASGTVYAGISSTEGVGLNTGGAAPTPAGTQVSVQLQSLTTRFEQVDQAGITDAKCVTFTDPRNGAAVDLYLSCSAGSPCVDLGYPNRIPSYVQPFDNVSGDPTFRLCPAETSAVRRGLVTLHSDERVWLGIEPLCEASDSAYRPRFFLSEEPPRPQLQEGRVFINATTRCNRDEGESDGFTLFLPAVRDLRPIVGGNVSNSAICTIGGVDCATSIVSCQLGNLNALLNCSASQCGSGVPKSLKNTLKRSLGQAIRDYNRGVNGYCEAKADLVSFVGALDSSPGRLNSCETALRARADGAIFELSQPGICP